VVKNPPYFMSIYRENSDFFDRPHLLTREQQTKPLDFIREFFDHVRLYEIRETMSELLEIALTTSNSEFSEPRQRSNAICFCHLIQQLVEASYILAKE
jgi:hypothetical protein